MNHLGGRYLSASQSGASVTVVEATAVELGSKLLGIKINPMNRIIVQRFPLGQALSSLGSTQIKAPESFARNATVMEAGCSFRFKEVQRCSDLWIFF